jgi:hypothetical protein
VVQLVGLHDDFPGHPTNPSMVALKQLFEDMDNGKQGLVSVFASLLFVFSFPFLEVQLKLFLNLLRN